jgi:hypothetical protein
VSETNLQRPQLHSAVCAVRLISGAFGDAAAPMGFNPWNIWGKMNGGEPKAGPGGVAGFTQAMLEETAEAMAARCAASDGSSRRQLQNVYTCMHSSCPACLNGSHARCSTLPTRAMCMQRGLRAAGYVYVNLDCGWTSGHRDAAGLQVNKTAFPSMEGLIDKIHSLGMKFGM